MGEMFICGEHAMEKKLDKKIKWILGLFTVFFFTLAITPISMAEDDICKNLTGTWYGTYVDTAKLFYEGGPWAMIMYLDYANGRFVGHVISTESVPPKISHIWGECSKGQLSNIYFLRSPQDCGVPSHGTLLSNNRINIQFSWKNPTGTGSTVFDIDLLRANDRYGQKTPSFLDAYMHGKNIIINKSCL